MMQKEVNWGTLSLQCARDAEFPKKAGHMETEWITLTVSPEGLLIDRLLYAVMFFLGMFTGWQLCLMNIDWKKSTTYQKNQIKRQWRTAENLANRFANALDCEKKGDIPKVNAFVTSLYNSWNVMVYNGAGEWKEPVFSIDIPYRPEHQLHITLPMPSLDSRLPAEREKMLVPGYIGRDDHDVRKAISDMKEILRAI